MTAPRQRPGVAVIVCCAMLFAIVFLQRLVLPIGAKGVSILLPLGWAAFGYLLLRGPARLDLGRTLAVSAFLGTAFVSQVVIPVDISLTSLLLLMAIYPLCCLRIELTPADHRRILGFFQRCAIVLALLTVLQIAVQLVGLPMPVLEQVLPAGMLATDFNHVQPIGWPPQYFKPNGLTMHEASFLSQFLGLAIVIELWYFRRPAVVGLLATALVLTFSGTGLGVMAVGLLCTFLLRGIDRATLGLILTALLALVVLQLGGYLDRFTERLGEFSQGGSSADLRFLAPLQMIRDSTMDAGTLLHGAGAGFVDRMEGVAWNPITKVWIEYGVPTLAAYLVFLASLVRAHGAPPVAAALLAEYLVFSGGSLLQLPIVLACLFLGFGYAVRAGTVSPATDPAPRPRHGRPVLAPHPAV